MGTAPTPPTIVDRAPGATGAIGGTGSRDGDDVDGRYPGGKGLAGLWQWILGQMPPHAVYAEPFAGRAAIARRKTPSLQTFLVESDPTAVEWLRTLAYPGAIVIHGDGTRWLGQAAERRLLDDDSLVYCDPPYVLSTRSKKRIYAQELTDADHVDLLRVIKSLPCAVMISAYWSELYAAELSSWYADKRAVITRGGVMRDEWLWCNFRPVSRGSSSVAVEYSDLGSDYRERERVARKVRRWQANLQRMPVHEREAVLRGLIDTASAGLVIDDDGRRETSPRSFTATNDGGDRTAGCDDDRGHRRRRR